MTARDILELDDAEFDARIEAVKRRMPTPPGAGLQPYVDDAPETVPTDHAPLDYLPGWYVERMAAHAASEIHDDTGDGVEFMGRVLIFAALAAAVIGVLVIVS